MSQLKISQRRRGPVVILDVDGQITLGAGTTNLRQDITNLVDGGSKKILLNLEKVKYVDSSGLGELVAAHARLARHGGELKMFGLASRVQSLLQIAKLVTVFETFASEPDAMRSFSLPRSTRATA
jgi:anti-sigma B factor antagonist